MKVLEDNAAFHFLGRDNVADNCGKHTVGLEGRIGNDIVSANRLNTLFSLLLGHRKVIT